MSRALLLVDHGSRRDEANAQLETVADALRSRLGPEAIVRAAHLEIAQPDIASAVADCVAAGADEIVVLPYFLGPGRHTTRDIPARVREAVRRHPGIRVRVGDPLGPDDALVDLLLDRAERARAGADR